MEKKAEFPKTDESKELNVKFIPNNLIGFKRTYSSVFNLVEASLKFVL